MIPIFVRNNDVFDPGKVDFVAINIFPKNVGSAKSVKESVPDKKRDPPTKRLTVLFGGAFRDQSDFLKCLNILKKF